VYEVEAGMLTAPAVDMDQYALLPRGASQLVAVPVSAVPGPTTLLHVALWRQCTATMTAAAVALNVTLAVRDVHGALGAAVLPACICPSAGVWARWEAVVAVAHPGGTVADVHVALHLTPNVGVRVDNVHLGLAPPSTTATTTYLSLRDAAACRVVAQRPVPFAGAGAAARRPLAVPVAACVHLSLDRLQHALWAVGAWAGPMVLALFDPDPQALAHATRVLVRQLAQGEAVASDGLLVPVVWANATAAAVAGCAYPTAQMRTLTLQAGAHIATWLFALDADLLPSPNAAHAVGAPDCLCACA
jgi:hypothetical protein